MYCNCFLIVVLFNCFIQSMTNPIWSKVILIGDSITQQSFDVNHGYWGSLIANELQRISDVVNRGFGGYNSRQIKSILPDLLSQDDIEKAAAVVILLGSNDCTDESNNQHISLAEYSDNIASIVNYLRYRDISSEKIILMTPPAYHHADLVKSLGFDPGLRRPEGYASVLINLAKELNVESLDIYNITTNHPNSNKLFYDGLHPNKDGAKVIFDSLWPLIKNRVTQFHDSFEKKFPIL